MLDAPAAFASQVASAAGGGHWARGRDLLRVSVRTLARYRVRIPEPHIAEYAAALDEAARGIGDQAHGVSA